MEFLVEVETRLPADMEPERRRELTEAELAYATDLAARGVIQRIWRVPGRTASKGIWVAADATELHRHLAGLPLFAWLDVHVTALATHVVEDSPRGR